MIKDKNLYESDIAIPPGETLSEVLFDQGMKQLDLARRVGMAEQTINGIIKGKKPITPETAIKLERVLNVSASFWNNLEKKFREDLARIEAFKSLSKEVDLAKTFSCYPELVESGYVEKTRNWHEKAKNLLSFFRVDSLAYVQKTEAVAYRKSKNTSINQTSLAAWLRCGEIEAERISAKTFDKEGIKSRLADIRKLTNNPDGFADTLQKICAEYGICVAYVPYFKNTNINGATRWLKNKALIQLNTRGAYSDIFWFTVFHEIGHVILHGKKNVFLDFSFDSDDKKEEEANKFAADILIDKAKYRDFCDKEDFSYKAIKEFAKAEEIDPSIVAGRLASAGKVSWKNINRLRHRIEVDLDN